MKIEGRNAINEAIISNKTIDKVMVSDSNLDGAAKVLFAKLKKKGIKIQTVSRNILDKQSETGHHQGFIAFASDFVYSTTEEILEYAEEKGEAPFVIMLAGLNDPHNLGSIMRTCECLGVHGIIIPKNRSVSVTDTVVHLSEGASEYVKVAKVTNINREIEKLKEKGLWIFGADMAGEDIRKTDLSGPIAIVIGAEGDGLPTLVKKNCDKLIAIKMSGKINSLNASVAAAVTIFEATKSRI